MAAGKYSFVIEQGATTTFELQYKDAAGSPIDLTGYQARMHIRPTTESTDLYIALSSSLASDGTGLNFNGSNGTTPTTSGSIGVYISATSSSLLDFSTGVYDLEIQSGSLVIRLLEGHVRLSKEVTR